MSLCCTADGWVAWHISNCIERHGKDRCFCTQSLPLKSRFDSGMSGTDYRNLIVPILYSILSFLSKFSTQKTLANFPLFSDTEAFKYLINYRF